MATINSRSARAAEAPGGTGPRDAERGLAQWLRGSLPAVLGASPESERQCGRRSDSSLDKTYELLVSVFSSPGAYIFRRANGAGSQACAKRTGKARLRCLRCPRFISSYLQNCQRIGADSPCKRMARIARGRQGDPFADDAYVGLRADAERRHGELVQIACLLIKFKKCIDQQCQRCTSTSELNAGPPAADPTAPATPSAAPKAPDSSYPPRCDKTVQCSKSTEFLRVSPELRFFSRSSLVINRPEPGRTQQQRQRRFPEGRGADLAPSPSLEYAACYRPELGRRDGGPRLRSFSSTAIFGLQSGDSTADKNCNVSSHKSRGRKRDRRADRIRELLQRTEDEMLRYSSFIEDDLSSLRSVEGPDGRSRTVAPDDVEAVKKILLDDYITEVKEIVRSEACHLEQEREVRVLEELKRRMDEDLSSAPPAEPAPSLRSDSCESRLATRRSRPTTRCSRSSYGTAREYCCRSRCSCCSCCRRCCEPVDPDGGCGRRASCELLQRLRGRGPPNVDMSKNCPTCVENIARRRDWLREDLWAMGAKAKSSHSLDSGVLADCPRQSGDWTSSGGSSARRAAGREEERGSFSGVSCTDEVLCQRVESAVRKFTEELILCERRARDRSRSSRMRRDKWRAAPRDQSIFNYPRNSHCSSEDEFITGISTPSLVSLSDSEIPTSIQT